MKKLYEKPMLVVERYELTQTIANCSIKIGFLDSACVKNDSSATDEMKSLAWSNWFTTAGGCTKTVTGGSSDDGICYHTNINAAFNS